MGTITATATGGTAPYLYSLDGTNYQASGLFTDVAGGIYTVYVKDTNGCSLTKQITIVDNGKDQYEGNNSKNQAKTINVDELITARLAMSNDPADWFKFTTTGAGNYVLTVTHPTVTYNFNLYAQGNNTPALVPIATTATTKEYVLAANTTYSISILTNDLSFTCYTMSVGLPATLASPGFNEKPNEPLTGKKTPIAPSLSSIAYPNPHQGSFRLQIYSPEKGMATIQLMNAEGKLLSSTNKVMEKGNNNSIEFTNIKEHILFYRVILRTKTVSGKIIRQQ